MKLVGLTAIRIHEFMAVRPHSLSNHDEIYPSPLELTAYLALPMVEDSLRRFYDGGKMRHAGLNVDH